MLRGLFIFAVVAALIFSVDIIAVLTAKVVGGLREIRKESRKIRKEFDINDHDHY